MPAPKHLKPGDMVWTDYRRRRGFERVRITARQAMRSQTGIGYKCEPDVSQHGAWLDAAWFWTDSDYKNEVWRHDRDRDAAGRGGVLRHGDSCAGRRWQTDAPPERQDVVCRCAG